MRILATDENNDLFLGVNGRLAVRTEQDALLQICGQVMQGRLGEMVFAAGRGLPYFETVWNGSPDLRGFEDAARDALAEIEGVSAVETFTAELADNALRYSAAIRGAYGLGGIGGSHAGL
jgi:hypothetical protein